MPYYEVLVDDNYHFMDPDERYSAGRFETAEAALAECRKMVDSYLAGIMAPRATPAGLVQFYQLFGDDPFIVARDGAPDVKFSAWDYAEQRAREMCELAGAE